MGRSILVAGKAGRVAYIVRCIVNGTSRGKSDGCDQSEAERQGHENCACAACVAQLRLYEDCHKSFSLPSHPTVGLHCAWQVSWLAGRDDLPAFLTSWDVSGQFSSRSPLTVAGAALALDLHSGLILTRFSIQFLHFVRLEHQAVSLDIAALENAISVAGNRFGFKPRQGAGIVLGGSPFPDFSGSGSRGDHRQRRTLPEAINKRKVSKIPFYARS
jgi:hypothetical protein